MSTTEASDFENQMDELAAMVRARSKMGGRWTKMNACWRALEMPLLRFAVRPLSPSQTRNGPHGLPTMWRTSMTEALREAEARRDAARLDLLENGRGIEDGVAWIDVIKVNVLEDAAIEVGRLRALRDMDRHCPSETSTRYPDYGTYSCALPVGHYGEHEDEYRGIRWTDSRMVLAPEPIQSEGGAR